ncbi:MAG: SGNH/GDSL hydrolase family protein [Lachnospiraceae bacterium]|nr:SGNH/GDSL hydrolase family protein [Lachnospiraceae bacterium]
MNAKRWGILCLSTIAVCIGFIATVNVVIDPFLHFHKPLAKLEYPLLDERYINDGIMRNYEYDAVITGTSMTQNFSVSQMNSLFNVTAIKVANSGATFKESADGIERAFSYNPNIKAIVMSLDLTRINRGKDDMEYSDYPTYLYDRNYLNDAEYVLNLQVLLKSVAVVNYTRAGNKTVSFDMYQNFDQWKSHGAATVLSQWERMPEISDEYRLTKEDYDQIVGNVNQNLAGMALTHPGTEFYFFFPPYSICYWDSLKRTAQLNADAEMKKKVCELLLSIPNVHIYDFSDNVSMIENLDNYSDALHYSAAVNDYILESMSEGKHELKTDTYEAYFDDIRNKYAEYDYSQIFE